MQTVKTTIVVVLLVTVTYSAYVALTAPPADLPPELEKLVENEGGDFLGDSEISLGDGMDLGSPGGDEFAGLPTLPPTLGGGTPSEGNADAMVADAAAGPQIPTGDGSLPGTDVAGMDVTGMDPTSRLGSPNRLPTPGTEAGPSIDQIEGNYPTTGTLSIDFGAMAESADLPPTGTMTPEAVDGTADSNPLAKQASQIALANAISLADRQREQDQLQEALATLSVFYSEPQLDTADRAALLGRLDWLAGEVIYSQRHLLDQPYRVSQGETIKSIAERLEVPWQLLGSINGVDNPAEIVPGQELKVIRGPFRAEINLVRSELTLFLGELYAGRFPIVSGQDPAPEPGTYQVKDKRNDRTYYSATGQVIPAEDPRNPYGKYWIDLGSHMCIHGMGAQGGNPEQACIQLRTADAHDVFGILSTGSDVTITR